MCILAVVELDKSEAAVGQKNGTDNPQEEQTKMTLFEINLKDKRFVSISVCASWCVPLSLSLYSKECVCVFLFHLCVTLCSPGTEMTSVR